MEINKKRGGPFFVLGEIAHKDVKNVTIQNQVHDQPRYPAVNYSE
jgi:hypothetical protein